MGFEGDHEDWMDEKDPERHKRHALALAKQKADSKKPPFPPAPLANGQRGVIILTGYDDAKVQADSGWEVVGGWANK